MQRVFLGKSVAVMLNHKSRQMSELADLFKILFWIIISLPLAKFIEDCL